MRMIRLTFEKKPQIEAHKVELVGRFYGKELEFYPMKEEEDVYIYELALPKGEYLYKFRINGEIPLNDPYSKEYRMDEKGNVWSVLSVNGAGQRLYPASTYTVNVEEHLLCSSMQPENRVRRKSFLEGVDKQVVSRLMFNQVTGTHAVTAMWCATDGELLAVTENLLEAEMPEEDVTIWFGLEMEKVMGNRKTGSLRMKLYIDGEYVMTDTFQAEGAGGRRMEWYV